MIEAVFAGNNTGTSVLVCCAMLYLRSEGARVLKMSVADDGAAAFA